MYRERQRLGARIPVPYGAEAAGGGNTGGHIYPFGRRVLVVEDNFLIASEWLAALETGGYDVVGIAVSAAEIIEICNSNRPDFILMDIRLLGQTDGVDAAIDVRARFDIPSIFISAHDDRQTRERAAPARPLGWIAKPIDGQRLTNLLVQLGSPKQ